MTRRWASWLLLLVVVVGSLAVAVTDRDTTTDADRVQRIAASVRCPTCRGQSVASSDAPAAANVRTEIERRVGEGESDAEIRDALVARFGDSIRLNPPRAGVAGLVWVLPVAGFVFAAAGLVFAFRRWKREW